MAEAGSNAEDPEIDRITPHISRSFLDVVDEAGRERGVTSRRESIRYALLDAVNHLEGRGRWRDLAISETQFDQGAGISSEDV